MNNKKIKHTQQGTKSNESSIEFADLSGANGWASHEGSVIVSGLSGSGKTDFVSHYALHAIKNKKPVILVDGERHSFKQVAEWLFETPFLFVQCSGWGIKNGLPKFYFSSPDKDGFEEVTINLFDVWRDRPRQSRMAIREIIKKIKSDDTKGKLHVGKALRNHDVPLSPSNINSVLENIDDSDFLETLKQVFRIYASESKTREVDIQDLLKRGIPIVVSVAGLDNGWNRMFGEFMANHYHEFVLNHKSEANGSLFVWDGHFRNYGFFLSKNLIKNVKDAGGRFCLVWEADFIGDDEYEITHYRPLTPRELAGFDKVALLGRKLDRVSENDKIVLSSIFQTPSPWDKSLLDSYSQKFMLLQKKSPPQIMSFLGFNTDSESESG